jgi:hypothetical protein
MRLETFLIKTLEQAAGTSAVQERQAVFLGSFTYFLQQPY